MVILQVLAPAPFGGLESVVRSLALGHGRSGHEVHVAAIVEGSHAVEAWLEKLRACGVELHLLRIPPRAYRRERNAVAELCRRLSPDVVHTHGYRVDVLDAGVARRLGIPTVTTVHGFTAADWKGRLYEALQRRAFRRFDAVVAVSAPLHRDLLSAGLRPDRLHLFPNAFAGSDAPLERAEARRVLGIGADEFHVGWVGRLSAEKGCDVLLEALGGVQDLPFRASVIGDGPERRALEDRARALGLDERVRWRGVIADASRLFRAFDVLVLSSRTEGTPIVLLEAMAAGVPIVATRVGGVPEMLGPEEAWLVAPDDPDALGAAIRAAHPRLPDSGARGAAAQRRAAADYALQPWLTRYAELYRSLSST